MRMPKAFHTVMSMLAMMTASSMDVKTVYQTDPLEDAWNFGARDFFAKDLELINRLTSNYLQMAKWLKENSMAIPEIKFRKKVIRDLYFASERCSALEDFIKKNYCRFTRTDYTCPGLAERLKAHQNFQDNIRYGFDGDRPYFALLM
jgi:hypothetical protein